MKKLIIIQKGWGCEVRDKESSKLIVKTPSYKEAEEFIEEYNDEKENERTSI